MTRAILHSDINSFYASVEIMLNPSLKNKAVAVCGSTENRHGIVLAKSELAKRAGVKTGMVNYEARRVCPNLIMLPPQYEQYLKYSRLVREIYSRYTDLVEPFGMDECWLDVTGSRIFGSQGEIAKEILHTVEEELGLTVSIGVSFNKVFAKLGSDMKKPNAITTITPEDVKQKIWPLPADELIYVGRATKKKLAEYGIYTIGELALAPAALLQRRLGKNGLMLKAFANGEDSSPVMHKEYVSPVKSLGHGITCNADLETFDEVWRVILYLSQDLGHRLRVHELMASGVQLTVRDNTLFYKQHQAQLGFFTQSPLELSLLANRLFKENYNLGVKVRSLTVRAIKLVPKARPEQLTLFDDAQKRAKRDKLDDAVEGIRNRFGKWAIQPASLLKELKLKETGSSSITMPGYMC